MAWLARGHDALALACNDVSSQTNLLMAAAVLFTLPIVILFFFTQRTLIRGIATTGLKG
jgi:ABC-type glycerol-3-phosphate transport system permease component